MSPRMRALASARRKLDIAIADTIYSPTPRSLASPRSHIATSLGLILRIAGEDMGLLA